MHIKSKLRRILGELITKIPVNNNKDVVINKQIIKNIIFEQDETTRLKYSNKTSGSFIKVLATDQENAYDLQNLIAKCKDELNIESVFVENKPCDKSKRQKQTSMFNNSVIIKLDPLSVLESALSITKDVTLLKELVLEDRQEYCQKVVIDYSSPNIAKPFHYGHLKSTILGNYLANLYKFFGHDVTRLNYIGDWGTQYGLLSLGLDKFDNKLDENNTDGTKKSALRHLLDVYVKANDRGRTDETFFIEAKRRFLEIDKDINSLEYNRWKEIRSLSLNELKGSYNRLGVYFDEFEYESDYAKSSIELVKQMKAKNLVRQLEDGVTVAQVEKNNRLIDINILKSDGASLYLTRDIAAAISRKNRFDYDKMLYIVGVDQERHFYCLKEMIGQLGHNWKDQLIHVKMGKVLGMSSRLGNVVLLSDIIDEATKRFVESTKNTPTSKIQNNDSENLEEVGKQLALSALFVYDMRQPRTIHYEFDWSLIMMRNNKSGINLQTTFARLSSLLRKSAEAGLEPFNSIKDDGFDYNAIDCDESINLINHLDEFDIALHSSYWLMDPYNLVNYAIKLTRATNRARQSENLWILGEADKMKARTRLTLFKCCHSQLELILKLLGLKPLYYV